MQVSYIDHMGSDLSVVNAARVSFAKQHSQFKEDKDTKLINYLAKHGHWTPFGHTSITLHLKAPVFIARQLGKHQVGFVWNEVSRRYVDAPPEFYTPKAWRKRPDASIKQGSGSEVVPPWELGVYDDIHINKVFYEDVLHVCEELYYLMIAKGVAPEQARMVLPQSMYTEWYWTGSLAAWARLYKLRSDPSSQAEIREIADLVSTTITELYPVSWRSLTEG